MTFAGIEQGYVMIHLTFRPSWVYVPQGGFSSTAITLLVQESVYQTLLYDLEMA